MVDTRSSSEDHLRRGRALPRLLGWLALGVAVVLGAVAFLRKDPSELPVYVLGAQRMLLGAEIYVTRDLKPFTYPPFFAVPFVPFAWLPEQAWRPVWYCVTLAALVGVLAMLRRFFAAEPWSAAARRTFWILLAVLCARHVLAIFENQSHDMLVLLCTAGAALAWARGADARAGAWAGAGAACKATPGLFGLPFVLQGGWRAAGMAVLVGTVLTLLPDLLFPRQDGRLWVMAWAGTMLASVRPGATADLEGTWTAGSILNQSLSGTVYRLTTPLAGAPSSPWEVDVALAGLSEGARGRLLLAAQLAVLLVVAWLSRPGAARLVPARHLRHLRLAQAAAVACGMVLLSPMSSKSHFGVLLLPVGLSLALLCRGSRDRTLVALLAVVFVAGTLTTKGLVGRRMGNLLLGYGAVTWAAVAALLASARAARLLRGTSEVPR